MRSIVFDMSDMHLHGSAFYDFLKLRKRFFVDALGWSIPTDGIVEMDQYDTPLAHYSLVEHDGSIVAGARVQSSVASWGEYTSMMKDAARGLLPGIPRDLFDPASCEPSLWEGTRLVVADEIGDMRQRMQCLALAVDGLMRVIAAHGGTSMLTFSPLALQRTARVVGVTARQVSRSYVCADDGREYAVFRSEVRRDVDRLRTLGIDPETHVVVEDVYSRAG